jgi:hypothetical protein
MPPPSGRAIQMSDCDVPWPKNQNPNAIFLPFGDQTGSNAAPRRSRQLGHSRVAITADVYGHPDDDALTEAAARVGQLLS